METLRLRDASNLGCLLRKATGIERKQVERGHQGHRGEATQAFSSKHHHDEARIRDRQLVYK